MPMLRRTARGTASACGPIIASARGLSRCHVHTPLAATPFYTPRRTFFHTPFLSAPKRRAPAATTAQPSPPPSPPPPPQVALPSWDEVAREMLRPMAPEVQEYLVNHAPGSASVCRFCGLPIAASALRIGCVVRSNSGDFSFPTYSHVECFAGGIRHLFPSAMTRLSGIDGLTELEPEDLKRILQLVVGPGASVLPSEVPRLAKQAALLRAATAHFKALSPRELEELAEDALGTAVTARVDFSGGTRTKSKKTALVPLLADAVVFGVPAPCGVCGGRFTATPRGYACTGYLDEFTRCTEIIPSVSRKRMKRVADLPRELVEAPLFGTERILNPTIVHAKAIDADTGHPNTPLPPPLFAGMTFHLLRGCGSQIASSLRERGADVVTVKGPAPTLAAAAQRHMHFVVAPSKSAATSKASAAGLPIVSEAWISLCIATDTTALTPDSHALFLANAPESNEEAMTKLRDKMSVTVTAAPNGVPAGPTAATTSEHMVFVSGGAAVDTHVEGPEAYVVHSSSSGPFHASLAKTDLGRNVNSFYIMQVLRTRAKPHQFFVLRRWGRVGEDDKMGKLLREQPTQAKAEEVFTKVYLEKTGNVWGDTANFEKHPGLFNHVAVDYEAPTVSATPEGAACQRDSGTMQQQNIPTQMEPPTRDLMCRMFDSTTMETSLRTMNIDTRKMPLGSLGLHPLEEGRRRLALIQKLLKSAINDARPNSTKKAKEERKVKTGKGAKQKTASTVVPAEDGADALTREDRARLLSLSNQFYSFIPQHLSAASNGSGSGAEGDVVRAALLDTPTKLKLKFDLLDDLSDIVQTRKIMEQSRGEADPVLACFRSLDVAMHVLSPSDGDFAAVSKYFEESQGITHASYKVRNVWRLSRNGERERFGSWSSDENRLLLWHGSRFTNWARILQQGLRIAPPEAPVSGYMFGKGVYFADMVSKSANYCHVRRGESGLVALAEVALGKPHTLYSSDSSLSLHTLPPGTHSTFAIGQTGPRKELAWKGGVRIPTNFGATPASLAPKSGGSFSLRYNERIVYDVSQIQMRFIVEVAL